MGGGVRHVGWGNIVQTWAISELKLFDSIGRLCYAGIGIRTLFGCILWQGISSYEDIVGLQFRGDYVILWEL